MEGINGSTQSSDYIFDMSKDNALALALFGIYKSFIGLTCTFGNSLIILAVLTTRKLQTPANIFILSLAFADMSITTFMEPLSAYAILLDREKDLA